jgi:hypothetical protein
MNSIQVWPLEASKVPCAKVERIGSPDLIYQKIILWAGLPVDKRAWTGFLYIKNPYIFNEVPKQSNRNAY